MSREPMSEGQFMDMFDKIQSQADSLRSELSPPKLNLEADESPDFHLDQNTELNVQATRNIQKEYLENAESSTARETKLSLEEEKRLIFNPDLSIKMEQSIHPNLQTYKRFAWETISSSEAEENLNFNLVRSMRLEQGISPNLQISRNMQGEFALEVFASQDGLTGKQSMNLWLNESIK